MAVPAIYGESIHQLAVIHCQLGVFPDQGLPVVALAPVLLPIQTMHLLQNRLPLPLRPVIPAMMHNPLVLTCVIALSLQCICLFGPCSQYGSMGFASLVDAVDGNVHI